MEEINTVRFDLSQNIVHEIESRLTDLEKKRLMLKQIKYHLNMVYHLIRQISNEE